MIGIVVSRDDEICEFQMYSLLKDYLNGFQNILKMCTANVHVEFISESLNVDVESIGDLTQFSKRFLVTESVGYEYTSQAWVCSKHVHDVFKPNRRLVVRECYGIHTFLPAHGYDFLCRFESGSFIARVRLRYGIVLAMSA